MNTELGAAVRALATTDLGNTTELNEIYQAFRMTATQMSFVDSIVGASVRLLQEAGAEHLLQKYAADVNSLPANQLNAPAWTPRSDIAAIVPSNRRKAGPAVPKTASNEHTGDTMHQSGFAVDPFSGDDADPEVSRRRHDEQLDDVKHVYGRGVELIRSISSGIGLLGHEDDNRCDDLIVQLDDLAQSMMVLFMDLRDQLADSCPDDEMLRYSDGSVVCTAVAPGKQLGASTSVSWRDCFGGWLVGLETGSQILVAEPPHDRPQNQVPGPPTRRSDC